MKPKPAAVMAGAALMAVFMLAGWMSRGCPSSRPPIHLNPNMDRQPKYLPQAESPFFYNGGVSQAAAPASLARGDLRDGNEAFFTGRSFFSGFVSNPLAIDEEMRERGKERFEIYCTPCHGTQGDGQSMMLERAGIKSANLLEERIRQMRDGEVFKVITEGRGLMPSYRYPIAPRDRWLIVAHVRALQRKAKE